MSRLERAARQSVERAALPPEQAVVERLIATFIDNAERYEREADRTASRERSQFKMGKAAGMRIAADILRKQGGLER